MRTTTATSRAIKPGNFPLESSSCRNSPLARDLFLRSRLPTAVLRKVWSLADVDQDYRLNAEEFVIAMYFINLKLRGGLSPFFFFFQRAYTMYS